MTQTQKAILEAASLNPTGACMAFASKADTFDCCELVNGGLAAFTQRRLTITLSGKKFLQFNA